MLERVVAAIFRYNMIAPHARAGVAVSGGADSVCLLHLLFELAASWNLHLTVLHFNHKLRGAESDADEAFVRELAARLSLPFESGAEDVAAINRQEGGNLEQTARRLRRQFFDSFLLSGKLDRIALGHTRSDQAETLLFRLLRGTGLSGFAGILPVTADGLIRPLIEIERPEIEAWLRERSIPWREDSTNRDCAFARNRIRRHLLPALRSEWNPELPAGLGHLAALAYDEEQFWTAYIKDVAAQVLEKQGEAWLARSNRISELPRAVARRLIRHVIGLVNGDLRQIECSHIERILELTDQPEGSGRLQVPGADVFRSFDWVRFAKMRPGMFAGQDYELHLTVPACVAIPGSSACISLEVIEKSEATPLPTTYGTVKEVDWARVAGPLCLRNWRPGDRYQPLGHSREQKVKLLFQYARVPLWERRGWPIITTEDRIIWARRFGPAVAYAANSQTKSILRISERSLAHPESDAGNCTSI